MTDKVASIYQNIYNQELKNRSDLDSKFPSRFTFLITIFTASSVILSEMIEFFSRISWNNLICTGEDIFLIILLIISIFLIISLTIMCFTFHKAFFRKKQNYLVMPTMEINMFHVYICRNNLYNTSEEKDLYNYMVNSYQFCSLNNANINSSREKALIAFDNSAWISFSILIMLYVYLRLIGYSINWIF